MNTVFISVTLLVLASAAHDTNQPDESLLLEVSSSIDAMKKTGATEQDCADLAKSSCDEVLEEVSSAQKEIDGQSSGNECFEYYKKEVKAQHMRYVSLIRRLTEARLKLTIARGKKVFFPSQEYSTMLSDVQLSRCSWAFKSSSYRNAHNSYKAALSLVRRLQAQKDEAWRQLQKTLKIQQEKREKCSCAVVKRHRSIWTRLNNSPVRARQMRMYKKCQLMKCVLSGISPSKCNIKVLPLLKNKKLYNKSELYHKKGICRSREVAERKVKTVAEKKMKAFEKAGKAAERSAKAVVEKKAKAFEKAGKAAERSVKAVVEKKAKAVEKAGKAAERSVKKAERGIKAHAKRIERAGKAAERASKHRAAEKKTKAERGVKAHAKRIERAGKAAERASKHRAAQERAAKKKKHTIVFSWNHGRCLNTRVYSHNRFPRYPMCRGTVWNRFCRNAGISYQFTKKIEVGNCGGQTSQKWVYANHQIRSLTNQHLCINHAFYTRRNRGLIDLHVCNHHASQKWVWTGAATGGGMLKLWGTNMCLTAHGHGLKQVYLWQCHNSNSQKFHIYR